ncbi:RNA polymerase sigma factor [Chitinophaga sp. 22620]|uniref:RNA polymerase sigma factor n=1 Tax=Chitinophaga sp. 22620 TaxID=3453952 RepID=UPI003F843338
MSTEHTHVERELLSRIAQGDADAFRLLYDRYWKDLFTLAARMLRGEEEAADVLQDVFLSLWQRRAELDIQGSLAAYLHSSVRYKVRDYIAKNITRRDYLALLTDTAVNTLPPSSQLRLELKEVQQAIQATVSKMPARMREAYLLRRGQHLSYAEIAEKMGTSPETARKQVQQALLLIKNTLGYTGVAVIMALADLAG